MATVSILSSGRCGEEPKMLAGISSDSLIGFFFAIASATSTDRNLGSPRAVAVAAIASTVILLLSGPTAMKASIDGSRAISLIWLVPNWLIVTLSGLMPDSLRITRSSVTLACVRPITPTRWPAGLSRGLIFGVGWFF